MLCVFVLFWLVAVFGTGVAMFAVLRVLCRRVASVTSGDVFCRRVASLWGMIGVMTCETVKNLREFTRGTTPQSALRCKGVDLTDWDVFVTFEQGDHELTVTDVEVETVEGGSIVRFTLTQEDTLGFKEGTGKVQVRAVKDGKAIASRKNFVDIGGVLLDGVIGQ